MAERVKDHGGIDHKSHILKYSLETGHEHVKSPDFQSFLRTSMETKESEKLSSHYLLNNYIHLNILLNILDKPVPLKLFN